MPATALAHDPGLSVLDVAVRTDRITASLSMAASDLREAEAVVAARGRLDTFALESIELFLDNARLDAAVESRRTDPEGGGTITLRFPRAAGTRLTVRSLVPHLLVRGHRQFVGVRIGPNRMLVERMLDRRSDSVEVDLRSVNPEKGPSWSFLRLGVSHILGGYDHLLFLAALLLGVRRLRHAVQTVTAFTVAHSLTLSLAVLGVVQAPATIVEPIIAASIVFVGVENLVRGQIGSRWLLTFAFGLVHGFGFAAALQELGVGANGSGIVVPLGLFNAGVEVGQLGVATALWPLIHHVNARPSLQTRLVPACSVLVVVAGAYWLVERAIL
jgi:hydrogenase/urease accessory protein HupE